MLGLLPFTKEGRRRAAARWFARMHGPDADRDRADFEKWRSNEKNAQAFARVSKSYDAAALLRLGRKAEPVPPRRPAFMPSRAAAAVATFALLLPVALVIHRQYLSDQAVSRLMYSTSVGEIRPIRLPDGSNVILDTGTMIEVVGKGAVTEVRLKRGRARFSLTRPLTISSVMGNVAGRPGTFDISLSDAGLTVANLDGDVAITKPGSPTSTAVPRRQQLQLMDGTVASGPIVEGRWPAGLLEFDNVPLGLAVERANRYSIQRIRLADRRLENLRLTGVFKAGNAEVFANAIAKAFDLKLTRAGRDFVLGPRVATEYRSAN